VNKKGVAGDVSTADCVTTNTPAYAETRQVISVFCRFLGRSASYVVLKKEFIFCHAAYGRVFAKRALGRGRARAQISQSIESVGIFT
jgi:hypothetical protein